MNEPEPVRSSFYLGLAVAIVASVSASGGIILAVVYSPRWLALPVGVFGLLALDTWLHARRRRRRDAELAALIGHDLDGDVDLGRLNLARWDEEGERR